MATSVDPQSSTQPLSPAMVYQATSPQTSEDGHSAQDPLNIRFQAPASGPTRSHIGHESQKPIKFSFHAVATVRLAIIPLAVAGNALSFTVGIHAMLVLATVLRFCFIAWNLYVLVAIIRLGRSAKGLPKFLCQIGGCVCGCGGDSDDEEEARRRGLLDEATNSSRRALWLKYYWLVDVILATVLFLFTYIAAVSIDTNNWYWIWPPRRMEQIFALTWVVVALGYLVAAMSNFKLFRSITCFLYSNEDEEEDYQYRIRLPEQTKDTKGKQSLSVMA